MAGFNENTRVKFPALMHLARLGYKYRSLGSLTHLDHDTNIDVDSFKECIQRLNPLMTPTDIDLLLGDIKTKLNNEDLGREFYKMLLSRGSVKLIDYEHPGNNSWECVTEMPCRNGMDEFRPDITLLINGMPLVFIEVKKPNNQGGIQVELHRMNDGRLPNTKYRRFLNMTQLMIFSDNKEYDFTTMKPLQGAFYGCRAAKRMHFNVFREDEKGFYKNFPYQELDAGVENFILKDNNYPQLKSATEYHTDKQPGTPTNRILTSMCSKERLLYLLRYGFVYLDYIDEDTHKHILEKHVMRYPQFFGTRDIRTKLSEGVRSGIIWHTQGSGKTALSYFAMRVLVDYYAKLHTIPKFYFFVDRIDLLVQATSEFSNRGLKVINVNSREDLMATFNNNAALEGTSGEMEVIVVNIQKLEDRDGQIRLPEYATHIQRVFFLDEAHRDYNPKGSFLARLFESDPNAIRIALTGTPLIGEELKTKDVFGDYISTYYYNRSIEDGFTRRIMREDIETSYRTFLENIWKELESTVKVKKEDIRRQTIIENPRYVGALLDYIVDDFKRFRLQQGDNTLAGMIVCETNPQARMMFRLLKMGRNATTHSYIPESNMEIPEDEDGLLENRNKEISAELILHDYYNSDHRKEITNDYKKRNHPDILIVNNMLLTGFDAPRLKRLYLGRKLKAHTLLQALTRVNRTYKNMQYGYVVDFADIKRNFESINEAYAMELNQFNGGDIDNHLLDGEGEVSNVLVSKEEIEKVMNDVQKVMFDYRTENAEQFAEDMEEIADKNVLIEIRHNLEEAKSVWNSVRTFGSEELKEQVKQMQPGDINNLLKVVTDRIANINLKNAFSHESEVSSLINEALATIDFKFRKVGTDELSIEVTNLQTDMNMKRRALSEELDRNVDKEDVKYVSLIGEIKEYFGKRGFEARDVAEAKENIQYMDKAIERIKEINRRNRNLQIKYHNDSKYVRIHKRVQEHQEETEKVLISAEEVRICKALNAIKAEIDNILTANEKLIQNEPYFEDGVRQKIAITLDGLNVHPKPSDRRYLAGLISNEYVREYKGV